MTEQTTPENGPEITPGATNESAEVTTPEATGKPANREARYRVERNEAREALAAAQKRIQAFERAEVLRLASDLAEPGDLLTLSGKGLDDFRAEDGSIDAEAVTAAVADVLSVRPGLARSADATDPTQGLGGVRDQGPSWGDVLGL